MPAAVVEHYYWSRTFSFDMFCCRQQTKLLLLLLLSGSAGPLPLYVWGRGVAQEQDHLVFLHL
jgi:hypothetical protein